MKFFILYDINTYKLKFKSEFLGLWEELSNENFNLAEFSLIKSEADVINVALFGMTAGEWRNSNPDLGGNIRDYTDILHLIVLSNLEVLNASMIDNNIKQGERLEKLNATARKELSILSKDKNILGIEKLDNNSSKKLIDTKKYKNNII